MFCYFASKRKGIFEYFTVYQKNHHICEAKMTQHDKHQYYFEKYLRNEMPVDERKAFEQQLSEDAPLRMAYEYYKLNRQQLLKDLIEEHKLTRNDSRLNKLIFLFISLTGITLTFFYFTQKKDTISTTDTEKNSNIFVRYIPFLNWENRTEKKEMKVVQAIKDSAILDDIDEVLIIDTLEPSTNQEERLASDDFIIDTFVTVIDKATFDFLTAEQHQKDSLQLDSIMLSKPILKPIKDKRQKLLVEFWKSPVNYTGYLYAENKLVLYGLEPNTVVYIYKWNNELYAAINDLHLLLTEKNNFTRF